MRAFTRDLRRYVGPEIYVPAPDMGTNERDMRHIRDCISYGGGTSITVGCFVPGNPGIVGRRDAVGRGVGATVAVACSRLNLTTSKLSAAVDGFGNVGSATAIVMAEQGSAAVAVFEIRGGAFVIPDIFRNFGGAFVSYLEYTQKPQRDQITRKEVERRLGNRMHSTFEQVYERSRQKSQTMRHAAMDPPCRASPNVFSPAACCLEGSPADE